MKTVNNGNENKTTPTEDNIIAVRRPYLSDIILPIVLPIKIVTVFIAIENGTAQAKSQTR